MSDNTARIVSLKKTRAVSRKAAATGFQYLSYKTRHRYPLQFAADFGAEPGPWLAINFQSKVFVLGWLPKKRRF